MVQQAKAPVALHDDLSWTAGTQDIELLNRYVFSMTNHLRNINCL